MTRTDDHQLRVHPARPRAGGRPARLAPLLHLRPSGLDTPEAVRDYLLGAVRSSLGHAVARAHTVARSRARPSPEEAGDHAHAAGTTPSAEALKLARGERIDEVKRAAISLRRLTRRLERAGDTVGLDALALHRPRRHQSRGAGPRAGLRHHGDLQCTQAPQPSHATGPLRVRAARERRPTAPTSSIRRGPLVTTTTTGWVPSRSRMSCSSGARGRRVRGRRGRNRRADRRAGRSRASPRRLPDGRGAARRARASRRAGRHPQRQPSAMQPVQAVAQVAPLPSVASIDRTQASSPRRPLARGGRHHGHRWRRRSVCSAALSFAAARAVRARAAPVPSSSTPAPVMQAPPYSRGREGFARARSRRPGDGYTTQCLDLLDQAKVIRSRGPSDARRGGAEAAGDLAQDPAPRKAPRLK